MSNPLRWFRKNAKLFMVVFGVGAMVIFGLGSVATMVNPADFARRSEGKQLIARWNGGDITRDDIRRFTDRHFQSRRFLEGLQRFAASQKGDDFRSNAMPVQPLVANDRFDEQEIDDSVVSRILIAERAREEGVVVNEDMVGDYLAMVAGEVPVTLNQMKQINREVNTKQVELEHVIRHLKTELAYQQMLFLTEAGFPRIPNPTEAIQYYDRTHRQVECKVVAFPVDQYANTDEAPPNGELRKLYTDGKFDYPDPTHQDPGFKVGRKVKVQYLVADYETFLENEMVKLTDEEVQKEYERLVAEEDDLVMEVIPDESQESDENALPGLDDSPQPPTEGSEQGGGDAAPMPPTGDTQKTEAGDQQSGQNQDESGNAGKDDSDNLQSRAARLADQYVKTQDSDPPPQQEEQIQEQTGAESEQKTNEEAVQQSDPGSTGDQQPQDDPAAIGPVLDDEQPKIEKRSKPLKDVQDEIKRRLKAKDAREAIDLALNKAESDIRYYQMRLSRFENKQPGAEAEKPESIDFASQFPDLQFNETALVQYEEMLEEPLGKVITFVQGPDGRPTTLSVANLVFNNYYQTEKFAPGKVEDFATRSTYLYWMSEKVDQKVRTFEEARDDVIKFWKRGKAVEAAREAAQKLADQVNSSGKSLAELKPDAVDTGAFTWFNSLGQLRFSTPIGVTEPGDEFMSMVFNLTPNKAGAAGNLRQDTFYTVQMIKDSEKTAEELGEEYLSQQFFTFKRVPFDVASVSDYYTRETRFDWRDEFTKSMGLQWIGR